MLGLVLAASDTATIAITAGVSAGAVVFAGVAAAALNGWNNRKLSREQQQSTEAMRAEDWARQDRLAAQVKAATDEVSARAEEARIALEENQEQVARSTAEVHEKLEVIRVDVNSNMTAAMQAELDATIGQLAAEVKVIHMLEKADEKPSKAALVATEALEGKIAELRAKLSDRLVDTKAAAKAAKTDSVVASEASQAASEASQTASEASKAASEASVEASQASKAASEADPKR